MVRQKINTCSLFATGIIVVNLRVQQDDSNPHSRLNTRQAATVHSTTSLSPLSNSPDLTPINFLLFEPMRGGIQWIRVLQ